MTAAGLPALAGGEPIRSTPLPYGRHDLDEADRWAVQDALLSGVLTGGRAVSAFETALAERCGVAETIAVSNGTAALHLALAALGAGPGDEVITTPLTFVATANAALFTGAAPVFADIGPDRCLDPEAVAALVSPQTRAVTVVDYAGLPADTEALSAALPAQLPIVVDAAHSLGGSLRGWPVGSLGTVTTLSFHPVKQITTGEGGACLTQDPLLARRIRALRNHGMTSTASERTGAHWRYDVTMLGTNYRLTDIQAALGLSQLRRLDAIVARRAELASRYDDLLSPIPGIACPPRPAGRESAWHLYAVEIDEAAFGCSRDTVIDALRAEGIEATLHYPPVHLLSLYRDRGHEAGLAPKAETVCSRLVTLPLFPSMRDADQDDVVGGLLRLHEWCRHPARV